MVQELIFEEISKDEYSVLESQIKRLPLTQSSIFKCDKYFKIVQDNQTLGLFVLSEHRYIGGLIHGVTLDCGPVWFKGHDTKDNFTAFSETFNETYPKRLGRKRRWIPNQTYTPTREAKAMRHYGSI